MKSTMGERLKELRSVLGLKQSEFADRLGLNRSSVTNYELGRSTPLNPIQEAIIREFNVNRDWLLEGTGPMFRTLSRDEELQAFCDEILSSTPADFRKRLVKALSKLSVEQWEMLEKMVKDIASTYEPAPAPPRPVAKVIPLFRTTVYVESVGAGLGQFVDSTTAETIDLIREPPPGTSFMLKVTGDSMVPRFQPDDYVFVKETGQIEVGQIGIFSVYGEMCIKKYTKTGLKSLNPNYDVISPSEGITCQGLVLGVADDSYFE